MQLCHLLGCPANLDAECNRTADTHAEPAGRKGNSDDAAHRVADSDHVLMLHEQPRNVCGVACIAVWAAMRGPAMAAEIRDDPATGPFLADQRLHALPYIGVAAETVQQNERWSPAAAF